jgi:hypothetical protein
MLWLTAMNYLVPQNIWRYRRDVAQTDVVITEFGCTTTTTTAAAAAAAAADISNNNSNNSNHNNAI